MWQRQMLERAPRVSAGVARRHGRRRARDPDHLVGGQAEPEMRAQVRMEVDEPGRDELAGRVDALDGAIGGDAGRHRGDLAVLDPDVALAAEPEARIEDLAAGDHQLVFQRGITRIEPAWHRRRHRLGGCGLGGSGRSRRGGRDDETATRHVHGSVSSLGGVDPRLPLGGRVADGDVMAIADQRCAQQARLRLGASEHALGRIAADVQSERTVARPVLVDERGRSELLDEPS